MAKKKATAKVTKIRFTRAVPAVMLQPEGETPDYRGEGAAKGSTRTLPAEVATRLIAQGHAQEA